MNILLSVQNLGLGGVTTYVLHLASGLSKNNKVIVYDHNPYYFDEAFCHWLPDEVIIEKVRPNSIKEKIIWKLNALLLKLGFTFSLWEVMKNKHFRKTIIKHKIMVIASFDKFSDRIVIKNVKKDEIPLVLSLHGSYDISKFHSISDQEIKDYEKVFMTAKAIIYKTECNIKILENYSNLNNIMTIKRIFHGFVLNKSTADLNVMKKDLGIGENTFIFGMIGRGVPEKGWKEALEAFVQLQQETQQEIHFIAIGKSEYLSSLKEEYRNHKNIHFTGFVRNSIDWISILDVGVLPTYAQTENFTFSVVEYMFCGKPAVTTDHGEIRTTIDANGKKAGILTPLKNGRPDIQAINQAMKVYLEDKAIYREHAALAPLAFKKFDTDLAVAEYEDVFNLVLHQ